METANALPAASAHDNDEETPFVVELLGLIGRIIATALAINIVFAGIVLLLAGQAEAAHPGTSSIETPDATYEMRPGRANRPSSSLSPRDLKLAIVHRLTSRPPVQFNPVPEES